MSTLRKLRAFALVLSFVAPGALLAQGPSSTGTTPVGTNDPFWQVAVDGGAFSPAWVLNRGDVTAPPRWIGASESGSLPGGQADGFLNRFLYSWQTSFLGNSGMTVTYRCAYDDLFYSVLLNGSVVSGAGCDAYGLGSTYTISGFTDGVNVLRIESAGNGVTDGLLLDVTSVSGVVSPVPEPASLVLFASGLLAIGLVAEVRRRA